MDAADRFWAPSLPLKALYEIDVEIGSETGAVSGTGLISFANVLPHPLKKLAFKTPSLTGCRFTFDLGEGDIAPADDITEAELPVSLEPGAVLRIPIRFEGISPVSQDGVHRLSGWHPKLWWGYPTCDDYDIGIQATDGSVVVATGKGSGGRWAGKSIRSFGIATSLDHETEEVASGGVEITTLHNEAEKECAQLLLETAGDVVSFYRSEFGLYPQPSLSIIPGGMSSPSGGFPFATSVVGIHGQGRLGEKSTEFWRWITAHEIGHQYWGEHVLEKDDPGWLWIGLGVYMDREYALSRELGPQIHRGMMRRYVDGAMNGIDTTVDRPREQLANLGFDHNNIVKHGKGYSIISALESVLGHQTFRAAFQTAMSDLAGRRLGPREFQAICEQESGEDLGWFFDQWVRSNRILSYQVKSVERSQEAGRHLTVVTVERLGNLSMPIPVQVSFEDGSSSIQAADRLQSSAVLRYESNARAEEIVLDPDKKLAMLESLPPPQETDVIREVAEMSWTGATNEALRVLPRARGCDLTDASSWGKLGLALYDGDLLTESMEAFCQASEHGDGSIWKMAGLAWQGHILDLQGMRDDALRAYEVALAHCGTDTMCHGQYGIEIDRSWIQSRIEKPFERQASCA